MRDRVVPFLVYLLVLAASASKANAGFVLPDTLIGPISDDCGSYENATPGPAADVSAADRWHQPFAYAFARFLRVSEASAPETTGMGTRSLERSAVPEVPWLNDHTDPSAESVAGLLCGHSMYGFTRYVCRLFRPPRENALLSRYPCFLFSD
jgi:hypothetical protein